MTSASRLQKAFDWLVGRSYDLPTPVIVAARVRAYLVKIVLPHGRKARFCVDVIGTEPIRIRRICV